MKAPSVLRLGMWLSFAALATLGACAGGDEEAEEAPVKSGEEALIATQTLASGRTLLVYDLGDSALFAERGDARIPTSLDPLLAATETPVQTWARLVPQQAAPAALVAVTKRMQALEAADPKAAAALRAEKLAALEEGRRNPPEPMKVQQPIIQKQHCGNICCNFQAMSSSPFCRGSSAKPAAQWFVFDQPGDIRFFKEIIVADAAVCAASQTRWRLSFAGHFSDLSLDPGEGMEFFRSVGLGKPRTFDSQARVVTGSLTHCGHVWRDK